MSTFDIFESHGKFDAAYVEELAEQSPDVIWAELTKTVQFFDYAANPVESEEWIETIMTRMTDEIYQYDDEEDDFLEERAKVIYLLSQASNFTSATCLKYVGGLHQFDVLLEECKNDDEKFWFLNEANMYYVTHLASTLLMSDQLLVNLTPVISNFMCYMKQNESKLYSRVTDHAELFCGLLDRYQRIATEGLCTNMQKVCLLNNLIGVKSPQADKAHAVMTTLLGERADNVMNIAQLLQLQDSETYWKEAIDNTVQPSIETPKF